MLRSSIVYFFIMQIELSKAEYRELLQAVGMANYMFELITDLGGEKKYVSSSKRMNALQDTVSRHAEDFGIYDWAEEDSDGSFGPSDATLENISAVINDMEEFFAYEHLSNMLAWRDFHREHTREEIENMIEEHHGYFGVLLYDYEERYWNEFDSHGFKRLEIVAPHDQDIKKKKHT